MKRILILTILSLFALASPCFACSKKDQLHVVFTGKNKNVSHQKIVSLGKALFDHPALAKNLHAFKIDTNHAKGEVIVDVKAKAQKQAYLKTLRQDLKKNQLSVVRVSYEQFEGRS